MRGLLGTFTMLAIIGGLSWECLAIICMEYRVWLPPTTDWMRPLAFSVGPPALTAISVFARMRTRRWRRMENLREQWPGGASGKLARGEIHTVQRGGSKTMLETLCGISLFLGVAALPYWMGIAEPGKVVLAGLVVIGVMRRLLR